MKSIRLKIFLILAMLFSAKYSCVDENSHLDLYVEPYYRMMDFKFRNVDMYYINPVTEQPMWSRVSQDFDNTVYATDSLAMYFHVPDTALLFHSQNNIKKGFGFMLEAYANNTKRPGYMGTLDLVEKIHIASRYDFDEMHGAGYDLSDVVYIFAYSTDMESGGFWSLDEYNAKGPHTAPKRFHLLFKPGIRPISSPQQFVLTYHLVGQHGLSPRQFQDVTPVFNVRTR